MYCCNARFTTVYGTLRPVYLFFAFLLFSLLITGTARADQAYLDALLASAKEKHLSQDPAWNALVHYKRHGSGRKSLVDDPRFFLASNGKNDPDAELDATLASYFLTEQSGEEHPRCRFPARFDWLSGQLGIDVSRLAPADCSKFNDALTRVNPRSAALVFPTTLNNSPASMFGHTLIRIDSDKQSDLLSYAVTYAAVTTDKNGFLYAFKGIFGYYHGYFTMLPYYEKVAEYSNIEHRDIWEYQLNLTEEEVRRLVMHVWELRDIYADYFFFDENCSFDLLLLLEVARPSLRLSDVFWEERTGFWVVPVDTIRVIKDSGLVVREKYRPSQAARILGIASHMEKPLHLAAIAVAERKAPPESIMELPVTPAGKAQALDLATELLQYRFARKQVAKEDYLKQFLATLRLRSTLGAQSADAYAVPPPVPPEDGHLPGRFSIGPGWREGSSFMEIGWRAAYHDLLDPDAGYSEGAQINFFDLRGRYFVQENTMRVQSIHIIDIVSLAPRNDFFQPVSWKVNTGFDLELFPDGEERLVYRLNPGGGFSYKNDITGLFSLMLETDLNVSGALKDGYALGLGGSAGIIKQVGNAWKIDLRARGISYEAGEKHHSARVSLAQNLALSKNNSLTLSLARERSYGLYQSQAVLMWNVHR